MFVRCYAVQVEEDQFFLLLKLASLGNGLNKSRYRWPGYRGDGGNVHRGIQGIGCFLNFQVNLRMQRLFQSTDQGNRYRNYLKFSCIEKATKPAESRQ